MSAILNISQISLCRVILAPLLILKHTYSQTLSLDLCKTRYNTITRIRNSTHNTVYRSGTRVEYLTEYTYTEKSIVRFSLIQVWIGLNYFLLMSTINLVKKAKKENKNQNQPQIYIYVYVGTYTDIM